MTTQDLVAYYVNLLILQYHSKPKAQATIAATVAPIIMPETTVELITFSAVPTSGAFTLVYDTQTTASLNWNATAGNVQSALQALTGLGSVTVAGNTTSGFTVTFTNVIPPAEVLGVGTNTLLASAAQVFLTILPTDQTLPLDVQAGFNLIAPGTAVGVQLDVLGKYAGVTRTGQGFSGQITLNDTDFLSLVRIAIIKNSSGSSLAEIQQLIFTYFANQILVFDYQNMQMSFLVSTSIGSTDLLQLFITEGLLPKPMAVQVGVIIYSPVIDQFFGFRTYNAPAVHANPFNDYASYQTDWPWLTYADGFIVPT